MVERRRGGWLNLRESAALKMKWSFVWLQVASLADACASCGPLIPHHTFFSPCLLVLAADGVQFRDSQKEQVCTLSLLSWSIGGRKNRKTQSFWWAEGRWKQRWIYFPLKAFVMRDKHIILTPPFLFAFVLCTRAYLREEAIIFAGSGGALTLVHWNLYSTNEVRKMRVWWRLMVLAAEGEKNPLGHI